LKHFGFLSIFVVAFILKSETSECKTYSFRSNNQTNEKIVVEGGIRIIIESSSQIEIAIGNHPSLYKIPQKNKGLIEQLKACKKNEKKITIEVSRKSQDIQSMTLNCNI
jgi:hypothetical protein